MRSFCGVAGIAAGVFVQFLLIFDSLVVCCGANQRKLITGDDNETWFPGCKETSATALDGHDGASTVWLLCNEWQTSDYSG